MHTEELYNIFLKYPSVQTDTRKLINGDLYFALKGKTLTATSCVAGFEKGAAYAIVDEEIVSSDKRIIKVGNVLQSLQQLAKHHRQQFNIPVLAITGSNGKTTTKELIHAVLSSHFKTYTTEGNLNNHIGIPLTLLKIKSDAEIAVIEMGANHQQEIASYCTYTLPTHGLISNCGKAHLEGFGGIEGVKKGKGELYDFIKDTNGTIFINKDYEYLRRMSLGIQLQISYGTVNAETTGHLLESEPFLKVEITSDDMIGIVETHLVGDYNLPNVLAAISVGRYFNVPSEKTKQAIEAYSPSNSRSQLVEKGTNKIILDAYNANPSSMKLAIENFARLNAGKKVLLLGGMAEMGEASLEEHQTIIHLIQQFNWTAVVLVGGDYAKLNHPFINFSSAAEAREWFQNQHFEHTHFLIKGSRSMKMEEIIA